MPDEQRDRFIQGFRWCPSSETIQPWEEDQDFGCNWCAVDLESLGPHLKLVLARASDETYDAYVRLRDHVNILRYAEIGEPEEVAAQMWTHYKMATKGKDYPAVVTNLVKGMAVVAVRAIANGRWARLEHENAVKVHEALTAICEAIGPTTPLIPADRVVLDGARAVLAETKLYSQPPEPPYGVDLSFLDPEPQEPAEAAQEAPESVQRVPEAEGKELAPDGLAFKDPETDRWRCVRCGALLNADGECDCPRVYVEGAESGGCA